MSVHDVQYSTDFSTEEELTDCVTEHDSEGELSELFSEEDLDGENTGTGTEGTHVEHMKQGEEAPLFRDSDVSSSDFSTTLVQRHNSTYSSQNDILKLLSIVLPSSSNVLICSSTSLLATKKTQVL